MVGQVVRGLAAATAYLFAFVAPASAQTPSTLARDALGAFMNVCVETRGDRDAALERLRQPGWTAGAASDVPRTRRVRSETPLADIQITVAPEDVIYTGRTADDALVVLQIGQAQARDGAVVTRCRLYAPGVSEYQLAAALFPNRPTAQDSFIANPITTVSSRGRRFSAASAYLSIEGPYGSYQKLAIFSIDARAAR